MRTIITGHATSWHDGGVALSTPSGAIIALAAERVGDRYKHSWNSRLAYEYLRQRLPAEYFADADDRFVDPANGLESDGHHLYHAASTFFGSGFARAAVLVVDGQGPAGDHLSTTTIWHGRDLKLELLEDINVGHEPFADRSVGHFYTAVAALAGFGELYSEGKSMALAAYGRPTRFLDFFREYVRVREDGGFDVDPLLTTSILAHTLGPQYYGWPEPTEVQRSVWARLNEMRQAPPGATWPTQDDMNIAYAGQTVLEEVLLGLAARARDASGETRLCIAGGVGLNCVANGKILRSGLFDEVFVVPAPADDGQALGRLYTAIAAAAGACPPMTTSYLGPAYHDADIESAIRQRGGGLGTVTKYEPDSLIQLCAGLIAGGKVLGWFHGRAELGPRALGNRSILADPRRPDMRGRLNEIKGREWFRPVAPVVLEEAAHEFFEIECAAPFMTFAVPARAKAAELIPAAVHADRTARIQTVSHEQNPRLHGLVSAFARIVTVPVLLNTSFNGPNEPIVETPGDAIESFLRLGLDYLVLDRYVIEHS